MTWVVIGIGLPIMLYLVWVIIDNEKRIKELKRRMEDE